MGKKMKKVIRFFKKITPFKLFMAILLFPLIVSAIYRLPLSQIICIEVGDLLSFYGVAFGIFSSWLIYWDVRKKIKSRFLLDFLYYVPYAVLSAMTLPAVFYSGNYIISAVAGVIVACVLAFFERGLLTVAACACAGVALTELVMRLCGVIQ